MRVCKLRITLYMYVPSTENPKPTCYHRNSFHLSVSHSLAAKQAQAALMHDAVFVLIEGLNKFRRKGEKSNSRRSGSGGTGGGPSSSNQQPNATLDCNSSQGLVSHWEFGEKIAKSLRKVSRVGGIETLQIGRAHV